MFLAKRGLKMGAVVLSAISAGVLFSSCSSPAEASGEGYAKDSETLVVGVVPDQAGVLEDRKPMFEYFADKVGKNLEIYESANYAALVEAATAGKIDLGVFSGFTYISAKNAGAKIEPIGVQVPKKGGEAGYESLTIVPKNSDIKDISDLKGKKVCFVDPGSTSGYLYPSFVLKENGISAEKDVTAVFAGGHDASAQKVAQGVECDAGFAEDVVVEVTGIEQGLFKKGDLKVINRTDIPGAPIVYSTNLPKDIQSELKKAADGLTIEDIEKAGIKINSSFEELFYELVPVDDKFYDSIREVCEVTKASQCNQ